MREVWQNQEILERDGLNELEKPPKPTLLLLFLMQRLAAQGSLVPRGVLVGVEPGLTSFIIILLMISAIASILVNATGPKAADPLSYTTGTDADRRVRPRHRFDGTSGDPNGAGRQGRGTEFARPRDWRVCAENGLIDHGIIVLINAGIAAWTESKAGDALEVLRDGKEVQVAVPTVVAGDIVVLGTGDVVPADLRLFEAKDFKVSEMALTGEPDDVAKTSKVKEKKDGAPEKLTPETMAFSGCSITSGVGMGLVTDTGMRTRIGRIAQLINGDGGAKKTTCFCFPDTSANQTPLQQNLNKLGARIGVLAIVICIGIFIIGWLADRKDPTSSDPKSPAWLYMILVSVTLAVAAIPEGIPLCVTISLPLGFAKLPSAQVDQEVLVRKIAAVETLGSASVICSDKTGTLTEGKMTMVGMYAAGTTYEVTGKGFDPEVGGVMREDGQDGRNDLGVKSNLLTAILCCNTTLSKETDEAGVMKWTPKGNSSEAPIVVAARKAVGITGLRGLTVSKVGGSHLCQGGMPLPPGGAIRRLFCYAPNYIIDLCCEQLNPDGSSLVPVKLEKVREKGGKDGGVAKLSDADKSKILKIVDGYSARALRVLAIAARPMSKLPPFGFGLRRGPAVRSIGPTRGPPVRGVGALRYDENNEDVTTDQKFDACRQQLRLMGLVASIDPERDGVPDSVVAARGAGIRVVMITGDYLLTAIAIAKNVNILQDTDDVETSAMDCASLRPNGEYLSNQEMDLVTCSTRVFARAKPEEKVWAQGWSISWHQSSTRDKLEIVKSIQRQGQVAAMTGDGVNDAPALNQADIGVAMGIQGTEVAKGASDMVLTDDNFCSIVNAVEKGRAIYSGIQKFVAFIMSVHIAEVMQIFICIVIGIPVMRTPLQILFLILVTDLPPSIALGMEPGEAHILKMRPRPKEEPIVLMWMWLAMIMNGMVLTVVVVAVYIISLIHFCDGEILQANIYDLGKGFQDRLAKAQTVAFISLVWSENIRAYISRSFTNPMWHDILGNKHMQKAIIMAQVCLYVAVLTPYLSDRILGLRGLEIGIFGWALAIAGPVGCFILSESCKLISAYQARKHQESLAMSEAVAAPAKPIKVAGGGVKKGVKHVEPEPKRRSWFSCCMGGMF
ncbi:Calcium-transporting ATPase 1 (BACCA1) [Durusdinium trenchii]|uniref:Calcium-transporting ATPase 1 (BACCA1) n=1 Tax=Durusdinium trenchii TaxID=1381693 RepID=A0ABP0PUL5_9DINO